MCACLQSASHSWTRRGGKPARAEYFFSWQQLPVYDIPFAMSTSSASTEATSGAQPGTTLTSSITSGSIWKGLLSFFFPILLGTFFQQLYNTVDAVVVGRFVGKEALAAVGGGTAVYVNLLVGFFIGLSSGASVIISQFYGANNKTEVSRSVHTAITLSLAAGAVMTVAGSLASPLAM